MKTEMVDAFLDARARRRNIDRPGSGDEPFDLDDGYAMGAALSTRLQEFGYTTVGRKIAFTNKATWEEFGLHAPLWAHLYDRTVHVTDKGHMDVSLQNQVAPRIEPELVVKVNDRIGRVGREAIDLIGALEWMALGFEIVDCHYADWKFQPPDALADFGFHGQLIVGPPMQVPEGAGEELCEQLATFGVSLSRDSVIKETGVGSNTLGSPIKALGHLMELLESQAWASPLEPGEIITTGTLTAMLDIHPGETWSVKASGLELQDLSINLT